MSFFADLFGGKSGVKAANAAAEAQQAANARARTDLTDAYTRAGGRIDPYAQAGARGFEQYNDAIGVNGAQGYQNALTNFNADPFRAGAQDASDRAIRGTFRAYNGRGMGNSGAAGTAVGRVASDRYAADVADYRNRLSGAGQMGWQAAQTQAGLDTGQGQALSGNSMNVGNIEANRLMQGYQAKQQGMNNIMSAVGGAAQLAMMGFAPGAGGASAFGNMSKFFGGGGNSLIPRNQGSWQTSVYPGA
jgi:hypothetical protein